MALAKGAAALAAGAIGLKVLDSKTQLFADLTTIRSLGRGARLIRLTRAQYDFSIADLWKESASKWPDTTFVVFEHRRLTFRDMDTLSTQMAHWLLQQGIKRDDRVALLMMNSVEFIACWLALAKIGAQVAMINYNIKSKGLLHCISVANSVALLFHGQTEGSVHDIKDELAGVKLLCWGDQPRLPFAEVAVATHDGLLGLPRDDASFQDMRRGIKMTDNAGLIYTSGTTGLPKAANINHSRFMMMSALATTSGLGPGDKLYTCLPLFHSAGGGIGMVGCMITGATLVLARQFSASRFWNEIVANECTAFQYIGELGRYLVNHAKEHPEVRSLKHKVKVAFGNGLRPEVWDDFQDGFNIPLVVEFYGATEGNGALMNICHQGDRASRGAVGRTGLLMQKFMGFKVAQFDVEAEMPIRGGDGFCIECAPGEVGELLFPIVTTDPMKQFKGYTDPKATEKKILRDVFVKGDSWFRTGDLLSKDATGRWFFRDRIGDTFRWKGENCSTMEVSEIVSAMEGIKEANCYGVKVPGNQDGAACMVAIAGSDDLKTPARLEELQKLCQKELPKFAQPLFLRFLPDMDITGTFKHQKVELRKQGCDPRATSDALFWLSPSTQRYEKFEAADYQGLENGRSKL
uniref:Very long-chain fatty acid transport protein n=1 Tax=Alexandrium catenella TaxID=2925 RepID=A0A7S1LFN4_ALECA|mmetsp:Transcript_111456/g.296177  ORF Transcript_111456/g.296177 Transcript_111456/m.296177 type:complete len:634 (+) Transcript_111456:97-1998(+)